MVGHGLSIAVSKLASLGLAAKIGVGATVATSSVAGAGAAGVLPDQANERAREAIEAVTPIAFEEPATPVADDQGDNFGDVVSSDATGESDGEPGVDGSEISSTAPGAAHRPVDPGQAPAQPAPGEGMLDQAADTPAAPALPDQSVAPEEPPSTVPDAVPGVPETPPSTVPELGGLATDAVGTSRPAS